MSDVAIRVDGLSKRYRIGNLLRYKTLRDAIAETAAQPWRTSSSSSFMWALKDVSFGVKRGEVVGVIGRNGAGKTTLLKVLSRITEPTRGCAEVHGRVGSLLEVGTGFHPELTGRENIYLNGAILGMRRSEIERTFDQIVAFAEVEKFLDTPVKHYSMGMCARLGFAVAAHLEPEVLLVDEILGVGDIEFQRKCIVKMEKVAREGRTVVVVSHNMGTVRALCSRAILLERGVVKAAGPVGMVVAEYLNSIQRVDAAERILTDAHHLTGVQTMRVKRVRLLNHVMKTFSVYWQQPIHIALDLEVLQRIEGVAMGAGIRAMDGTHILTVHHDQDGLQPLWSFDPGEYLVEFRLENTLRPGVYRLHLGADLGHMAIKRIFAIDDAATLEVLEYTVEGVTTLPSLSGVVNGRSTWTFRASRTEEAHGDPQACSEKR